MRILTLIIALFISAAAFSQSWKAKLNDPTYNFYEVCAEVENYFLTHDKDVKGSGWKPYQRWKAQNEFKYFPTGDRMNVDPYFVKKAYQNFLSNTPASKNLHPNGWVDLGPFTIDSISNHYAAGLGRIEDFYVHPANSNIIYLASRSGGLWKTTDGGNSWSEGLTDLLFSSGVNAVTASQTNSDSVLINVRNASNGTSHGIYRSTDGGTSWTETDFNPTNTGFGGLGSNFQVFQLKYHPRVANLVYIGTNNGIYRSDDNLQTWTLAINFGDITQINFHPTDNNIIYVYDAAGTNNNNIEISTDQGLTYSPSNVIAGNNGNESVKLSVSEDCADCIYFASDVGVWKSTDEGQNFAFLSNPSESCDGFAVNDLDTSIMIYGYVDLENSTDGGITFENRTRWSLGNTNGAGSGHQVSYETSTNYIHADIRNLQSVNGVFYAATDGFLSKSVDNGVNWEIIGEGVGIRENYKIGLSQSNHFISVTGSQDNGTSIKKQFGWLEYYGADGMEAIVHPLNYNWLIGSVQYGNRRRSLDGGISEQGASPDGSNDGYWEAPLAYDPNNQMRIFDFREDVYRSDDFGSTHVLLGSPSSFSGTIKVAEVAQNNSDIMVVSRNQAIDLSTDGGVTFSSIKNNLPNTSITDVAFDPNNDSTIVVTYGSYFDNNQKIYISHNAGDSWENITFNLGNMPIHCAVIDHTENPRIYIGAEIGVYSMPLDGTNWELFNTSLANVTVEELEINNGSNTIKAATWGRGLWENSLIGREDYPAILTTEITSMPTLSTPKEGVDQYVTSTVHYDGALTSVYVKWSANNLNFDNTIAMYNVSDSTYKTYEPLPNFPEGTKMYFKVFSEGANNDISETYKFMYEVQPFEYCFASGSDSTSNPFIEEVNLGGIINTTGQDGYSEYTSTPFQLTAGNSYPLSVNGSTGSAENDYGAWIDYNADRIFTEEERVLFEVQSGGSANSTFTVPNYVINDEVVSMRVRVSYWGQNPSPCGVTLGEVEDYLVQFSSNNIVNLIENNLSETILFPNPNSGDFTIKFDSSEPYVEVKIFTILGELLSSKYFTNQQIINYSENLPAGNYFVEINTNDSKDVKKIIIR